MRMWEPCMRVRTSRRTCPGGVCTEERGAGGLGRGSREVEGVATAEEAGTTSMSEQGVYEYREMVRKIGWQPPI